MSGKINNGGSAFPSEADDYGPNYGMTLRDWFAGQALAGILADGTTCGSHDQFAASAFKLADAMLLERDKGRAA